MTGEARQLLLAALAATEGVTWGERFHVIVDALEQSNCSELIELLHAAAHFGDRGPGDRAWREISDVADEHGAGLVALDLVTEIGQRLVARAGGQREWSRGDENLERFAGEARA